MIGCKLIEWAPDSGNLFDGDPGTPLRCSFVELTGIALVDAVPYVAGFCEFATGLTL